MGLPFVWKNFAAASAIALYLGQPAAAQDDLPLFSPLPAPLPLVPFEELLQQVFPAPVTTPENILATALQIGTLYQQRTALGETTVGIEMEIRDQVGTLQKSLIAYAQDRPDYYFASLDGEAEDIAVSGEMDHATAALFIEMAAMEDMKPVFLDIPDVQEIETAVSYRFLRNELKRLAPEEYITGLATIAATSEIRAQEMQQSAFIECILDDRRLFSPGTVTEEMIKIIENNGYFTRLLGGGCDYYLRKMDEQKADSLQMHFLEARTDRSQKPDEPEWCSVFEPEAFTGLQQCVVPKV